MPPSFSATFPGTTTLHAPVTTRAWSLVPTTLLLAIGAAALNYVMFHAQLAAVWQKGAFFDTDDAMRLVQVRALLDGQSWFDMTAKAMDPPLGVFLHWSRVVDIPLAVLIKLFGLFTDRDTAERLTRLVFPFALLVGLYLGMARLGALLLGPAAGVPTMAATVLSGNGIVQFIPGRIDHHAPQIVILVLMVSCALASLDARRARQAAVAGALAALSLAISLENLPFIACLCACVGATWIWQGPDASKATAWFAAGLGVALPLLFAATVGPDRYAATVCDAFSAAHLGAGVIGASGLGLAASLGLRTRCQRLAAGVAVVICATGFVWLAYPTCLRSPFAGLDPLVREIWINNVAEALSFVRLFASDRVTALTSIIPVALGLLACLFATWRSDGLARSRFAILTAIVGVGLCMALWQVRVFTSVTAIALYGGVYVAISARGWCFDRGNENLGSLAWLLLFPFTATAWSLALPAASASSRSGAAPSSSASPSASCMSPSALRPLAGLSPGTVIAPLDLGSFLLADTKLRPYAAAYHRDNDGNHFALTTMLASPDQSMRMMAARGVTYLVFCPGAYETQRLAARNHDSLAAALVAGRDQAWLDRVALADTPLRVYKVHAARP